MYHEHGDTLAARSALSRRPNKGTDDIHRSTALSRGFSQPECQGDGGVRHPGDQRTFTPARRAGPVGIPVGLGQSPFPVPDHVRESLMRNVHRKDYLPVPKVNTAQMIEVDQATIEDFHIWLI